MHFFHPQNFFDLSTYAHALLFNRVDEVWKVIPQIKAYLQSFPLGQQEGTIDSRAYLIHPESITIGKGTIVEPGAFIQGPCIIGENCQIRHGAYIRGNVIIGNHCVIGHATEVKNSIFLDRAQAGHFAYLGDSILGNRVNLGAGTKCANLKLDRASLVIQFQKERLDTGMRKLGAIIGDDVQLGCNSVTNPGTFIGKNCRGYPCITIGGCVTENHVIKSAKSVIIEPLS